MNYYKQGNAANAEQIKAAFEKLGYSDKGFTFDVDNILFFTANNKHINVCPANGWFANIIKTHPDYKELELPVAKFKVGYWVVFNNSHNSIYQISKIRDSFYILLHIYDGSMPLSFSQENLIRPWTIEDAKDGDILVTTKVRSCPFIYRKTSYNNNLAYYYAGIDGNGNFCEGCLKRTLFHFGSVKNVVPATKEQRDLLFSKMKKAGYEWNADKKELRKIQPHYDINNFKPFDKVMMRFGNNDTWRADFFSHIKEDRGRCFVGIGYANKQCIPYNDDTKHLLGTTDMPSEEYINW